MYSAKVVADSIASHVRLITIEATFPRYLLPEVNTHRTFCLAGDSELEFDLPSGSANSKHRVHRMRIDEFVDKWLNGARRYAANPKRVYDTSRIDPVGHYSTVEAASLLGMAGPANLNGLCRAGLIPASRHENGRTWLVHGKALLDWRQSTPEHTRFDIRSRLAGMRIRQLNETTGDIQWANVVDAVRSGMKAVHEVVAGDFTVAGSLDHLVFTTEGWRTIGELKKGDLIVVRKFGKHGDDRLDPLRLKKIDGVWRCKWQSEERARLQAEDQKCRRCRERKGHEIHHLESVYQNPARVFDRSNITLLCERCHTESHRKQGWQGGTYLYGAAVPVEEVNYRGEEATYDLSISGEFPNFLANGVVVHNSRNSASSRAIPVPVRVKQVRENPFVPGSFTKNKRGMQADTTLAEADQSIAEMVWRRAAENAATEAEGLAALEVHKQQANRIIEPYVWHTALITSTYWDNFFALRIHPAADPEMQKIARLMKEAIDASTPRELQEREWHLPLVPDADEIREEDERNGWTLSDHNTAVRVSVARCAAISYDRQHTRKDILDLVKRHDELKASGHWSPFEHQAKVATADEMMTHAHFRWDPHGQFFRADRIGNFQVPWLQYRKTIPGEDVFRG